MTSPPKKLKRPFTLRELVKLDPGKATPEQRRDVENAVQSVTNTVREFFHKNPAERIEKISQALDQLPEPMRHALEELTLEQLHALYEQIERNVRAEQRQGQRQGGHNRWGLYDAIAADLQVIKLEHRCDLRDAVDKAVAIELIHDALMSEDELRLLFPNQRPVFPSGTKDRNPESRAKANRLIGAMLKKQLTNEQLREARQRVRKRLGTKNRL